MNFTTNLITQEAKMLFINWTAQAAKNNTLES